MLKEIPGVADDPPAKRRWFHDEYFDLFVWQNQGEVTLFQLCYGGHTSERALVWDSQRGFFHDGRFPTLLDVTNHYDACFNLGLSQGEKSDLVEFLKSR